MRSLTAALALLLTTSTCQGFVAPSHNSHKSIASTKTTPSTQLKKQQPLIRLSVATDINAVGAPGTADLPWSELGFEFRPTKSHLRMTFRDGKWQEPELVESPYINVHIGATALHYGQACFEGLKAFAHEDGSVNLFRPDENAKRINRSGHRVMMPEIPVETFIKACNDVVKDNVAYVPPYGSGGALYLRPLLFGSGPRIGLQPAEEYTFIVMVIPVGDYYKGGLAAPVNGLIVDEYDRAAPKGVGAAKVAGNYAADLIPNMSAKKKGFPICLYLDAATHTLVEEFSTSNFIGIDNENKKYITPKSDSVLPSITNKSLQTLAKDEGMTVEQRDIEVSELSSFDEVIACGTAVVVTPIGSLTRFDENGEETKYQFSEDVGETTRRLYDTVRNIQNGEIEDTHNWNYKVE
jgi:branched-chain amino acid aminotransferase